VLEKQLADAKDIEAQQQKTVNQVSHETGTVELPPVSPEMAPAEPSVEQQSADEVETSGEEETSGSAKLEPAEEFTPAPVPPAE
jgi:hypothetical protein